jgi:hypothetical protein
MITPTQQNILDSLVNEFNRINNEPAPSGTFNFIYTDPLLQKTMEIKQNKAIADADYQAWRKMAIDEADRLVVLLRQDLPNAYIYRHSKENRHYESATIDILRNKGASSHYESSVTIEVGVITKLEFQTHRCHYEKGVGLNYIHKYCGDEKFNTMQDLANSPKFQNKIRETIL